MASAIIDDSQLDQSAGLPQSAGTSTAAFVPTTKGFEIGNLRGARELISLPPEYDVRDRVTEPNWNSFSGHYVVVGSNGGWSEGAYHNRAVRGLWNRFAAQSIAKAIEQRHAHRSNLRAMTRDPLYNQLIEMGPAGTSVALDRLALGHRPIWLYFLHNTVEDRPASGTDTTQDAATAWRNWGRQHGLVP